MYTLQFDGLFKPAQGTNASEQAGFMCYGWLIWKDHRVIARGHGGVARGQAATSNTAEYMALIEGLEALRDMLAPKKSGVGICKQPVTVIGDARSVIDQMQRTAEVSSAGTRPMYLRARRISDQFMQLEWTWMPREKTAPPTPSPAGPCARFARMKRTTRLPSNCSTGRGVQNKL